MPKERQWWRNDHFLRVISSNCNVAAQDQSADVGPQGNGTAQNTNQRYSEHAFNAIVPHLPPPTEHFVRPSQLSFPARTQVRPHAARAGVAGRSALGDPPGVLPSEPPSVWHSVQVHQGKDETYTTLSLNIPCACAPACLGVGLGEPYLGRGHCTGTRVSCDLGGRARWGLPGCTDDLSIGPHERRFINFLGRHPDRPLDVQPDTLTM
jgi:hypothetical protein